MKYSLIKKNETEEFDYIDQDGISHNNPEEWLFVGILGGCGCGNSDDIAKEAVKVLNFFAIPHEDRKWNICDDNFHELLAHWMDKEGLITHGGGIGGAWLTEKGKNILTEIKKYENEQS